MSKPAPDVARSGLTSTQAAAWTSVLAACYGVLGTGTLVYLASGFASADYLLMLLGSPAPDAILKPYVAMIVATALGTLGGRSLARRDVDRLPDGRAAAHRAATLLAIALLLGFPLTQWLTFGRPNPMERYAPSAGASRG